MGDRRVGLREQNAQDISDLQAHYKKKKRDLVEQKEKEISATKEYYNERVDNAERQGSAAVNHIKKQNRHEQQALNDRLADIREEGDRNMRTLVKQEQHKREKIAGDTDRAARELNENRKEAERKAQDDMIAFSEKSRDKRTKLIEKSRVELQDMQDRYNKELKHRQETRTSAIEQEKARGTQDLNRVRNEFDAAYTREKESGESRLRMVQDRSREELERQNMIHDNKIMKARDENDVRLAREQERGESQRAKIANAYQRQVEQTSNLGERRVKEVEDKHDRIEKRQMSEHTRVLDKDQQQFEARREDMHTSYRNERERSTEAYRKDLKRQREHFDSSYLKNQEANQTSLTNQKENYFKQLEGLKKDIAAKVENYANKSDDPFYKVKDLGTRFVETPTSYILRTQVPEHEVQNVKVRVKDDQAIITGMRQFQDRVEEEGRIRSASSSESFKEIYKLEQPVAIRAVKQERDGDTLTVTIPKIGMGFNIKG
ncbi:MAG: Hsp20 family protein [Bdellovibrionaceae bacterium]|nr:Hsp20 family protein [Pseudobdellovibrionaceae bacterium]